MDKQVVSVKVGKAIWDTGIPTSDLNIEIAKAWQKAGLPK